MRWEWKGGKPKMITQCSEKEELSIKGKNGK